MAQASSMIRRLDARRRRITASVFFIFLRMAAISFKHSSIAFRYLASRRDKPFTEFAFVCTKRT
jgi:hypothetical protein